MEVEPSPAIPTASTAVAPAPLAFLAAQASPLPQSPVAARYSRVGAEVDAPVPQHARLQLTPIFRSPRHLLSKPRVRLYSLLTKPEAVAAGSPVIRQASTAAAPASLASPAGQGLLSRPWMVTLSCSPAGAVQVVPALER